MQYEKFLEQIKNKIGANKLYFWTKSDEYKKFNKKLKNPDGNKFQLRVG